MRICHVLIASTKQDSYPDQEIIAYHGPFNVQLVKRIGFIMQNVHSLNCSKLNHLNHLCSLLYN